MIRSSKNRLTSRQAHLFPEQSLFGKIARAVCQAGVLPRKEFHEAWEMARRVRRRYRGGRVVELACGHGLLAHIMLILDDSSPTALAVDPFIPSSAGKLNAVLVDAWPRLADRIAFAKMTVDDVHIQPDDLVVSAHACGSLTDRILEKAAAHHARVAVLPCCHNLKESSTMELDGWMDGPLAVDAVRAITLQSRGYRIVTQSIPFDITPKNRLLMGHFAAGTPPGPR